MKISCDETGIFSYIPENKEEVEQLNVLSAECVFEPAGVLIEKLAKVKSHWEMLILAQQIEADLADYTLMILGQNENTSF